MSVNKTVREVLKSRLLLKQKKFMAVSPWAIRDVILIAENDSSTQEKSILQISNPQKSKVTTINIGNFVYIQPNIEGRTISIVLPDNSEVVFKAECHQLLVLWIAALKVAMAKGSLFHVKHRSRDGMVDEDALLQFIDISTEGVNEPDQILMLSSPLDDITRHAWRVSQIRQFRITSLGITIEFCINCYKTYTLHPKSFTLFVHTSVLHACVEFICKNTQTISEGEAVNSFVTVHKIKDHHCPISASPSTTPPPLPPHIDIPPFIPCRDHPRFGHLSGPPARPLPNISGLGSPYKITNKLTFNNNGTISQESTVFGHRESISNLFTMTPPRKQYNTCKAMSDGAQTKAMQQSKHVGTSIKLLPPKHIKRTSDHMHSKVDLDVDDQRDYVNSWLFDDYINMNSASLKNHQPLVVTNLLMSDYQNIGVHKVDQVSVNPSDGSHSLSDDKSITVDHDYLNIQNILNELDNSVPKSQTVTKPPIKKRTLKLIKPEVSTCVNADRPCIIPRKNSLASPASPASPKPIPRKRTISSNASPIQKAFEFSTQLKEEDDNVVIHAENASDEEIASQLDCEAKFRASPKNFAPVKNCDTIVLPDDDNVLTEDATTQQQGDVASVPDICPELPQPGITSNQRQVTVSSTDVSCSEQPDNDVMQLNFAEHNKIATRLSGITDDEPENELSILSSN